MTVEVLVVEDHPDIAYPLTRTLEREGYDVTWVENGRDAIEYLGSHDIDLIIYGGVSNDELVPNSASGVQRSTASRNS